MMKKTGVQFAFLAVMIAFLSGCQEGTDSLGVSGPQDLIQLVPSNAILSQPACEQMGGTWRRGLPTSIHKGMTRAVPCGITFVVNASAWLDDHSPEARHCVAMGGVWTWSGESLRNCVFAYPDAGQSCTSSAECYGGCIVRRVEDLGKSGVCRETTDGQQCFGYVEDSYMECLFDDVLARCSAEQVAPRDSYERECLRGTRAFLRPVAQQ